MPTGARTIGVASGPAPPPGVLPASGAPSTIARVEVPIDHRTIGLQSQASAGGIMSVTLGAPDVGFVFKIERILIFVQGSINATVARVYVGDPSNPGNEMDFSPDGNEDVADELNPILVPGGVPFTVVWSGASNGAYGFARIQYTVCAIVGGAVGGH